MSIRVWSRFQAARTDGSIVKLCIQDVPENCHEELIDFIIKYFISEETLLSAAGTPHNPKALEECRHICRETLKDSAYHTMICCDDKEDDEIGQIVGFSQTELVVVGSEPQLFTMSESKERQNFISMLKALFSMYDPFKELKISRYYDDCGLAVHPGFRKSGIATELLKARCLACVAHDVPATGALMTNLGSQKAAERNNWETVLEINLKDFGQEHEVIIKEFVAKLMIWRKT